MAWRSSGSTNEELVDNLKRFRIFSSTDVEAGFRNVDRRFFVPRNVLDLAHKDQPVKEGNVHLSAPHIYGSVLEALELKKDEPLTFLNAGSGSGYLTCIASSILGPRSVHYCVEIHEDVIDHSKAAISAWKEAQSDGPTTQNIHFIHGNALELVTDKGECAVGFDRIYIGAAIEKAYLAMFKKLLKPGGILVGPVDDELVKVVRSQSSNPPVGDEFTVQVLSGVRFAPLLPHPAIDTVIPARVWTPSEHHLYPDSFRNACKELLLCSNSKLNQPVKPQCHQSVNAASLLPQGLWMEILSYTHRDWFSTPHNDIEFLRRRLMEEKANAEKANLARLEAERRCQLAEKERDVYRLLARRWKSRLNAASLDDDNENETIEEAAAAMLLGGRESTSIFGIGNMFRRFRTRASVVASQRSDDDVDGDDESFNAHLSDRMEEDDDDDDEMSDSDNHDSEENESEEDDTSVSMGSMVDATGPVSKSLRSQATATTVSLAESEF